MSPELAEQPDLIIIRSHGAQAGEARGVVVVIDVIRAFTVAAYALAGGARELWLVRTVEEAHTLREYALAAGVDGASLSQPPLLAGEVGGRLIPGFDMSNSPSQMAAADVRGRLIIQRTGAGTQGAVGASQAKRLLVGALVNARATAAYARQLAMQGDGVITLLPTAWREQIGDGFHSPMEDEICADYLTALLTSPAATDAVSDAAEALATALAAMVASGRFADYADDDPDEPTADIPAVLATDRFGFAMEGERRMAAGVEYVRVRRV